MVSLHMKQRVSGVSPSALDLLDLLDLLVLMQAYCGQVTVRTEPIRRPGPAGWGFTVPC